MGAALTGQIKRMRKLVDSGANVNATDERKWTALMYAASQGELDAVMFLLQHGADPVLRNIDGHTAYDIAEQKGLVEIAAVLQKPNSTERSGR